MRDGSNAHKNRSVSVDDAGKAALVTDATHESRLGRTIAGPLGNRVAIGQRIFKIERGAFECSDLLSFGALYDTLLEWVLDMLFA